MTEHRTEQPGGRIAGMMARDWLSAPPPRRFEPGRRRFGRTVAGAAAALAWPAAAQSGGLDSPVPITVTAKAIVAFNPLAPEQRHFGQLEYLGGLELKSTFADFGGFSAIRVAPDGEQFVAVTDKGFWLTGRIISQDGRPIAIADAAMAPLLGPDGRPLATRGWYDTESLAEQDGWFYVGIERVNRIVRFDFARQGVLARAEVVPMLPGLSRLPYNKGLEALTFAPHDSKLAGALIAFSERGLDRNHNLQAFLMGGAVSGEFSVRRRDEFDISDCVTLPSGDVLLLERRFTWVTGVAMRLRRIALSDIAPGALVDGPALMVADMAYQIDNMEGLSAHTGPDGSTILTMISDDNFSRLQRTILLQFKLIDDETYGTKDVPRNN